MKRTPSEKLSQQTGGKMISWSSVGVFRMLLNGKLTYVNEVFKSFLGYKNGSDLLNKDIRSLCYRSDDKNLILDALNNLKSDGLPLNKEIHLKKCDNSPILVSLTICHPDENNSQPDHLACFVKDITSQMDTVEELQRSYENYITLFNYLQEGIAINELVFDDHNDVIDYRILNINSPFARNSISIKGNIIGKKATELYGMSPEYIKDWWKTHAGMTRPAHTEFYHKSGDRWFLITTTVPVNNRFATIFTEISEQKKVEIELRKSEQRLQEVFNNAADGILIVDNDSRKFISCNPMMCKLLGYTSAEILTLGVNDIHPEADLPSVIEQFEKQARKEISVAKNIPVERKDGSIFYADINSYPLEIEGKNCLVGLFIDITERKQNEEINKSRLHLIQFSLTHSLDELLEETLNETEKLTGSLIGFYHFVDPDQKNLTLQNWSARTKKTFCKAEGKGLHYAIEEAGVWVDCIHQKKAVIHNDYASLAHRKGMPDGHARVIRELVVPVFRNEKISAILGVGNKPTNYTSIDEETVTLLANFAWEIAERKRVEEALHESEIRVRKKLSAILSPDSDIDQLELSDIIDSEKLQSLMDQFYKFTRIGIGILDLKGNILVKSGWQDICTKFHRVNPESCQLCIESDLKLSIKVPRGQFKRYKCKNNMWDIATPIMMADKHVGNIFLGQFLYDDEKPEYDVFRKQARDFGFNEKEYLEALDRVPRWKPEMVEAVMSFYVSFSDLIGNLSYSNIKLANTLEDKKLAEASLLKLNRELRARSKCNEILLRSDNENILLKEICQTICDQAGYRLTWVGYVETDQAKTITPVAWAGHDKGFIMNARITWSKNSDRGWGPAGTAVRTGQTVYSDDIATDPKMKPWRESALNNGFCSSVAVPLKDKSKNVFGVLNVYSAIPMSFDTDEIRLLEELAGDLAYGIKTLRTRNEQIQAEKLLRISEERFSKVFSRSPVAIAIFRASDFCFIDVNDTFIRETGFSRSEIIGKKPTELKLFDNPNDLRKIGELLGKSDAVADFEFVSLKKSGEKRTVISTTIEINLSGEKHYLSINQDITERKKAESELRKLSLAMEQSPASVIITDTLGNIEYVNPKFTEITGYTREEITGKNPRILKSGEIPPETYKILWETISAGKDWFGEFHNRKKNGDLYWELASISPILDSSGNITNYLGIKEDITIRKQYEADLIKAKDRAEESDRLKTAFLHNISHEIRTPMNAIMGFSSLLGIPGTTEENQKSFIDNINGSCEHLLSIIDDLVNISSIEAKVLNKNITSFNLNSILHNLEKQYSLKAPDNNNTLKFSFGIENSKAEILSDSTKLQQILSNLLNNALKFTKNGRIEAGYKLKGSDLEFFVSDTGIGIAAEYHSRIFQSFFQVENTLTRQFGGTGLGLSISKAFVELLGGRIWLESKPGLGSVFHFTVPYITQADNHQRDTEPVIQAQGNIKNCTILVAEDNILNFRLIEMLLSDSGIKIIWARNGREAIEKCSSPESIDLVLMDLKMPETDGYTAVKKIRELSPDMPVIAETAFTIRKYEAMNYGFSDVVLKPFKKEELVSVIKKYLGDKLR